MLEVVFIRFSVFEEEDDDEPLGTFTLPVSMLLPGMSCLWFALFRSS